MLLVTTYGVVIFGLGVCSGIENSLERTPRSAQLLKLNRTQSRN